MCMKRHTLLPFVFAVTIVRAETVEFTPELAVLDAAVLPTTVVFELAISGIPPIDGVNGGLSSIDVVVGSHGPLTVDAFAYDIVWFSQTLLPVPAPLGLYQSDLYFGGAWPLAFRPPGPTRHLGLLTVGVPSGLAPGDYTFQVDSDYDQFSLVNSERGLYGLGTVRIVPEPATLVLAAFGAVWLLRGRTVRGSLRASG